MRNLFSNISPIDLRQLDDDLLHSIPLPCHLIKEKETYTPLDIAQRILDYIPVEYYLPELSEYSAYNYRNPNYTQFSSEAEGELIKVLKEDLCKLLLLSYYYRRSIFISRDSKTKKIISKKTLIRRTGATYFDEAAKHFKDRFFHCLMTQGDGKRKSYPIESLYDVDFLVHIFRHPSYNPLADANLKKENLKKNITLDGLIQAFSTTFAISKDDEDSIMELFGYDEDLDRDIYVDNDVRMDEVCVYNQFIAERITNINIINLISNYLANNYQFKSMPDEIKNYSKNELEWLVTSSLLNFRIKVAQLVPEHYEFFFDPARRIMYKDSYLSMLCKYHMGSLIPYCEIVFQYFMDKYKTNLGDEAEKTIEKFREKFFAEMYESQYYHFFEYKMDRAQGKRMGTKPIYLNNITDDRDLEEFKKYNRNTYNFFFNTMDMFEKYKYLDRSNDEICINQIKNLLRCMENEIPKGTGGYISSSGRNKKIKARIVRVRSDNETKKD